MACLGDAAQGGSALHSCDPNFADRTALIRAAEYGHTAIVKVTQLTPPLLLSLRVARITSPGRSSVGRFRG